MPRSGVRVGLTFREAVRHHVRISMPHFPCRVGNYVLFAELGTGTLGTTYIGREAAGPRGAFKPLAIRILEGSLSQRPEAVRIFLDEQRAAALLQHPRIAVVHEVGAMPDGSYFVSGEYVHGVALRDVIKTQQAQLSAGHAVHLAMQLCDALHYAHERHDVTGKPLEIVHGQLSSDAVIVGFDGNAKIIEFGCLRTRNITVANVSIPAKLQRRTPYMAPELRVQVHSGGAPVIDRRADVYSVGALLWEMLTGESLTADDAEDPPPPSSRGDGKREVPPEIDAIVKKAMSTKKDDRFPTALSMRLALSNASKSLFGETSQATVLARNMTLAFRQRKEAFQSQQEVWKKFDPDTLPPSTEPLTNVGTTQPGWRTASQNVGAFQSQSLRTGGGSQRINVASVSLQTGTGSANTRVDSSRMRTGGPASEPPPEEAPPFFKNPLFLGGIGVGVLAIVVAVVVLLIKPGNQPWSVTIDSNPRGAEILMNEQSVGTTPQRISRPLPEPVKIEIRKTNYIPYIEKKTPQSGENWQIDAQLQPLPSR